MDQVKLEKAWCRSGVFIVNFEHISHLVLVFLMLTLSRQMPVGLINIEHLTLNAFKCVCRKNVYQGKGIKLIIMIFFGDFSGNFANIAYLSY